MILYPEFNMSFDILESIHLTYKDDPDTEAKCYLYLSNLHKNHSQSLELALKCITKLDEMNRCNICGNPLIETENYMLHTEVDNKPIEYKYELKCPICDLEE